jgi:hypothetical protein
MAAYLRGDLTILNLPDNIAAVPDGGVFQLGAGVETEHRRDARDIRADDLRVFDAVGRLAGFQK